MAEAAAFSPASESPTARRGERCFARERHRARRVAAARCRDLDAFHVAWEGEPQRTNERAGECVQATPLRDRSAAGAPHPHALVTRGER
jgi:hypothetical protein